MKELSQNGEQLTRSLALQVGLLTQLLQNGAAVSVVQGQCACMLNTLKRYIVMDEDLDAYVQMIRLIPDAVAELLSQGVADNVPDDLSDLDDSIDPRDLA